MRGLLLIGLFSLFSVSALAGNTTAKIEKILMYEEGDLVYVYPEGGVKNPASCHGANGDYYSFKMSRPRAKEYLSVLMVAFTAQKDVFFRSREACIDQSVSETLSYFVIHR
ncbi:hypothetical protein [Pleionea sp. CnH1-48]|uniref:hypothetical protein n=1 Tax=Pleionea sp. CnH1-48 TaxID=2954494 RepID=UPI00209718DE|nr:hypothetical protein [Pleionea sp. CnH1-48]MCO7226713.1 hypothetical protein [Pleionea sp. CnH1-48]